MDQKVYELLLSIPRGRVTTYGTLAQMLVNRRLARAVGNALHRNPNGDRYPCYKVVNSEGALSPAYAFGGIPEQIRRLEADGITVENGRVDLKKYGYYGEPATMTNEEISRLAAENRTERNAKSSDTVDGMNER